MDGEHERVDIQRIISEDHRLATEAQFMVSHGNDGGAHGLATRPKPGAVVVRDRVEQGDVGGRDHWFDATSDS